jgi:hypothetical protein
MFGERDNRSRGFLRGEKPADLPVRQPTKALGIDPLTAGHRRRGHRIARWAFTEPVRFQGLCPRQPEADRIEPSGAAFRIDGEIDPKALQSACACVAGRAWRVPRIGETDCVADDAVSIGLVSTANSLLTGKLTGNFVDSGPLPRFRRPVG